MNGRTRLRGVTDSVGLALAAGAAGRAPASEAVAAEPPAAASDSAAATRTARWGIMAGKPNRPAPGPPNPNYPRASGLRMRSAARPLLAPAAVRSRAAERRALPAAPA